jgi:hypothetical protein
VGPVRLNADRLFLIVRDIMRTHEDYIRDVASFIVEHADLNPTERDRLATIKLVYGSGPTGTRGITFYGRWQANGCETAVPFVEVTAFGQSDWVQLAGTTAHELAHVLAGWGAGHAKPWFEACQRLGLAKVAAAGTEYTQEAFQPWLWDYVQSIEKPTEGQPVRSLMPTGIPGLSGPMGAMRLKGCQAGIGTRGGKSRGTGSGSRLKLYQCECGQKVRVAGQAFDATHNPCGTKFEAQEV